MTIIILSSSIETLGIILLTTILKRTLYDNIKINKDNKLIRILQGKPFIEINNPFLNKEDFKGFLATTTLAIFLIFLGYIESQFLANQCITKSGVLNSELVHYTKR